MPILNRLVDMTPYRERKQQAKERREKRTKEAELKKAEVRVREVCGLDQS